MTFLGVVKVLNIVYSGSHTEMTSVLASSLPPVVVADSSWFHKEQGIVLFIAQAHSR
jgi:hypothetical protein